MSARESVPLSSIAAEVAATASTRDALTVTVPPSARTSSTETSPAVALSVKTGVAPPAETDTAVSEEPVEVSVTFPSIVDTELAVNTALSDVATCSNVTYAPVPDVEAEKLAASPIVLSISTKPPSPLVEAEIDVAAMLSSSSPVPVPLISSIALNSTAEAVMSLASLSACRIAPEAEIVTVSPAAVSASMTTSRGVVPAVVAKVMLPSAPAALVLAVTLVAVRFPPADTSTEPLNVRTSVKVIASVSSIVMSPDVAVMVAVTDSTVVSMSIEPSVPANVVTAMVSAPDPITTSACRSSAASVIPPFGTVRVTEPVPPTRVPIRPTGMSPSVS